MKNTVSQVTTRQTALPTFRMHRLAACLLASLLIPTAVLAADLPTNGAISSGNGTISTSGNTTTVNQATPKLSINWDSFNIGADKTVNFNQPNANSIALNRVLGSEASTIAGKLNANGQVFLLNPNGVLFTAGAQVNVGGLVASTLGLSDADFNKGNYRFQSTGQAADVINAGTLNAHQAGGYITLLSSRTVDNSGTMTANGNPNGSASGQLALLAGRDITLNINGNNLVNIQVNAAALQNVLVRNSGTVLARNGRITMTASGMNQTMDLALNNTGTLVATGMSINPNNGAISLDAGNGLLSLQGSSNPYSGKTILAEGSLRAVAGSISIQGANNARQEIQTNHLDVTSVKNITVTNVNLDANGNQTLRSGGNIQLDQVNWNTQGGLTLRSFNGAVRLSNANVSAQDIQLNATQTVNGGGWRTGLGDAALVLNNVNLTAANNLALNGQTTVTSTANGRYGAGGVIIQGTSNLKATKATITGSSNSWYQSLAYVNTAGIALFNDLGLDGQFSFTGTSNGGVSAFYMAYSNITLAKNTKVNISALGNSDSKNLGLVGIRGINRIKGAGQFTLSAEANIENPAIFFYATTLEATDGADVRFSAKNTGTGSAIATTSDGWGVTTTLKNLKLLGESSTKAGISITAGTLLEGVLLDGKSSAGHGIEITADVLIYKSTLRGNSSKGAGIFVDGTVSGANNNLDGGSSTGAGIALGGHANVTGAQLNGRSNSGAGVILNGSVNNTSVSGASTGGVGVDLASTAVVDSSIISGNSTGTNGVRVNGKVSNSSISGSSSGAQAIYIVPGADVSNTQYVDGK